MRDDTRVPEAEELPLVVLASPEDAAPISPESQTELPASARPRWLMVLGQDQAGVRVADCADKEPRFLPSSDLQALMAGVVMRVRPATEAPTDPDAIREGRKPFGFGWFVPELQEQDKLDIHVFKRPQRESIGPDRHVGGE